MSDPVEAYRILIFTKKREKLQEVFARRGWPKDALRGASGWGKVQPVRMLEGGGLLDTVLSACYFFMKFLIILFKESAGAVRLRK